MQRWLKRAGLILFFGLWAAAGLQIWAKKQESREMEAVAAFSNIGTDNRSGIVQYYGKLKKRSRCRCWNAGKNTCGRSQPHLVFPVRFWSIVPTERTVRVSYCKRRSKRRYCAASCHLERKGAITGQSLYANVTIPGGGFEEAQTLRRKCRTFWMKRWKQTKQCRSARVLSRKSVRREKRKRSQNSCWKICMPEP